MRCLPSTICFGLSLVAAGTSGLVRDDAGLWESVSGDRVRQVLQRALEEADVEIVVHSVWSLRGADLNLYATGRFQAWKLGDRTRAKRGLLLVIAVREQRVRIEASNGLEAILADGFRARMERDQMAPYFERKELGQGMEVAAGLIVQRVYEKILNRTYDPLHTSSPAAGGNRSRGEGDEYIVRLPMPDGAQSAGLNAGPWRAPAPAAHQTQSGTDSSPLKQVERIRSMLRGRKFRELTAEAEAVQASFEADFHREAEVENWFEAFHTRFSPGLVDALFLEWERATPSSWAPMLARAYWKEDPSVVKDLDRVVELNPKLLAAHSQLITIASDSRDPAVLSAYLTKAIEQCPGCYLVRRHYMLSIQPRTCGSWEQMDAFAQESLRYAKENPRLAVLEGFSYWDRGRTKRDGGQPEEGLRLAMKSVEYGDDSAFYAARGNTYYALGRNAEALSDLNFAVELEPFNGYMYLWRSAVFAAMGNYPAASEDLKTAQALYYGRSMDEWAGQMRKWLARQVNR